MSHSNTSRVIIQAGGRGTRMISPIDHASADRATSSALARDAGSPPCCSDNPSEIASSIL
jgi:hypothetical protein